MLILKLETIHFEVFKLIITDGGSVRGKVEEGVAAKKRRMEDMKNLTGRMKTQSPRIVCRYSDIQVPSWD